MGKNKNNKPRHWRKYIPSRDEEVQMNDNSWHYNLLNKKEKELHARRKLKLAAGKKLK